MGNFSVVDGFALSTTLRLLPSVSRAHALAQLETLRQARGYKARYYPAPDDLVLPIAGYGQVETQIRMVAGTYIWGLSVVTVIPEDSEATSSQVRIQVTDMATEIPLFSDYIQSVLMEQTAGLAHRAPDILAEPRLIGEPGTVNVEIYNDNADEVTVQLVLYCAEPVIQNPDLFEGNHYIPHQK